MSFFPALAGVGSLVGGLSGLFGSHSVPQYTPTFSPYQVQGLEGQAAGAINNISDLSSIAGSHYLLNASNLPAGQQALNWILNNPYQGYAQTGAGLGERFGIGGAKTAYNQGRGLVNTGGGLIGAGAPVMNMAPQYFGAAQQQIPYLNQTLQTAFDPQQALYKQQLALTQNQQNVQNAQSGVANTPYGASLADLNLQNFNTNWQNNLLQRQVLGAQGAGQLGTNISGLVGTGTGLLGTGTGLIGAGANLIGQGTGLEAGAAPLAAQAGALPMNELNTYALAGLGGINQYQGLLGQYQGLTANAINQANVPFNDYNALLASMTGANNQAVNAYNAQLGGQQQQFAQNAWYGNQIGAGLYGIGRGFGNMGAAQMPALGAFG